MLDEGIARNKKLPFTTTSSLIIVVCTLLSIGTIVAFLLDHPVSTDLNLNFFAILSFLPLAVNVWIIVLISRLRGRSEESAWFVLYLCALSVACLGEGLQRLSATPDAAMYWYHLNGIGYALLPVAYYLFVFSYVRPLRQQSPLLIPIILSSSAVMLFNFVATDVFFSLDPSTLLPSPWGYVVPSRPMFFVFVAWLELLLVSAVVILVRYRRRTTNDLERKQASIYIWAVIIPLVGGTITDGILPMFGFEHVLPTSLFLSTGTSVVAYYGLRKFRSFQINPAEFAGNVVQTMHEAVIVTNAAFSINFVNQEAERLLGQKASVLLGQNLKDRFDEASWQLAIGNDDKAGAPEDKAAIGKLHLNRLDGKAVPVRVHASTIDIGMPTVNNIFIIADITDITNSYQQLQASTDRISDQNRQLQENQTTMERLLKEAHDLQKQLQEEKASVEHKVEVRTAELREARDKLKAADEMKSEFIMLSSHNLRTPLTIMRTSVELLSGAGDSLSQEQRSMIDALAKGTERLGEFIEDLLAIATLEAGDQLNLAPTKVGSILKPLAEEAAQTAASKKLIFHENISTPDAMVDANVMRLRGAIRNILQNAMQFTSEGDIWLDESVSDGNIVISVRDSGIGISPEEIPKLFEKFHRATSTLAYNYEGEGLGLYLAKLVVEEHGGKITVESQPGQGTTFTIGLPVATTKTAEVVPVAV